MNKKILIVDDEDVNVRLLSGLCESLGYETISAGNGKEAVNKAIEYMPDLILMDVMMPEMDGFKATEVLKSDERARHIPIIIVTALDSRQDRLTGISKGANDFLTKPIDSEELSLRLMNNLKIKEYHDFLKNYSVILEGQVAEKTRELKDAFKELESAHGRLKSSYAETIHRLALVAEYKDDETATHIRRTSFYTKVISERLGMNSEFITNIIHASPMHDIGKVGVPDGILFKPGPLDTHEWEIMKTHTTIGARILGGSISPFLRMGQEIALSHHERWDGSGYPNGLKGEKIPLPGRIMNICDQYDALRSKRPYKPPRSHKEAVETIINGDGRTKPEHFDPAVFEAFKKSTNEFNDIFHAHQE